MIMALVFARMLIVMGCILVALVGGAVLVLIGEPDRAMALVISCGLFSWMANPDAEDRAAFAEFQAQRLKEHESARPQN